ncbi:MAG: permease-like cell division protein FtsX [Clostridiales bacterium]|nr:permease-like cell division protein FtsX [Clostridiales bacterium]
MFSRTAYFIKEAMANIFSHGLMSFITTFTIICCLIIMGSCGLLTLNVHEVIKELESENQMVAYIDETLSDEEARALEEKILATENVAHVQFVTREEAMVSFLDKYENNSLFEDVDSSVFRNRYLIYLDDIALTADTQNAVAGIAGVAKINAHLGISNGFVTLRNILGIVALALFVVLFLISIILMTNTMKIATFNRRTEIAIMKMVGATNSFIRWPFVLEGMLIGLFSSLCAFLLQWGGYNLLSNNISGALSFINLIPFENLSVPVLVAFCVIGILEGVFGSLGAIKSYLRV